MIEPSEIPQWMRVPKFLPFLYPRLGYPGTGKSIPIEEDTMRESAFVALIFGPAKRTPKAERRAVTAAIHTLAWRRSLRRRHGRAMHRALKKHGRI